MNERFQALRKTATQLADDEVAYLERVHNRTYMLGEWSAIFSEKFAELIVRDVVATVKRTQETSPDFEWAILNNYDLGVKE